LASHIQELSLQATGLDAMFRNRRPAELGLTVEEGLAALIPSGMGDSAFSLCPAFSAAFWIWTFSLNHLEDEASWKTALKTQTDPAAQILLEATEPQAEEVLYSDEDEAVAQTLRSASHHAYLALQHQQPLPTDTPGSSSASSSSASGSASSAAPPDAPVPVNCTVGIPIESHGSTDSRS
jgi:hypothetical protein